MSTTVEIDAIRRSSASEHAENNVTLRNSSMRASRVSRNPMMNALPPGRVHTACGNGADFAAHEYAVGLGTCTRIAPAASDRASDSGVGPQRDLVDQADAPPGRADPPEGAQGLQALDDYHPRQPRLRGQLVRA